MVPGPGRSARGVRRGGGWAFGHSVVVGAGRVGQYGKDEGIVGGVTRRVVPIACIAWVGGEGWGVGTVVEAVLQQRYNGSADAITTEVSLH